MNPASRAGVAAISLFFGGICWSIACTGSGLRPAPAPPPTALAPGPSGTSPTPSAQGSLELIESWPLETTLDQPDLPDAREAWPNLLAGAQTSIDLSHMYVSHEPGHALEPVLAALAAAAARRVRIRLLVDAKFSEKYPAELTRLAGISGLELRRLDGARHLGGGVQHAKYFVVDGARAVLGSQNLDWRSLEHVQELGVVFTHPALVRALSDVFAHDWANARGAGGARQGRAREGRAGVGTAGTGAAGMGDQGTAPAPAGQVSPGFPVTTTFRGEPVLVTPLFSPEHHLPDPTSWDLPRLLALLDGAQQRIRVQVLTYSTQGYDGAVNAELDDALRRAAARRVSVELLVSSWNLADKKVASLRALAGVPNVQIRVVTIPPHSSGEIPFARVVHSKYLIVDGTHAWVGTSNWSPDYFHASRNVGLLVTGRPFAARLDALFTATWTSPYAAVYAPQAASTAF